MAFSFAYYLHTFEGLLFRFPRLIFFYGLKCSIEKSLNLTKEKTRSIFTSFAIGPVGLLPDLGVMNALSEVGDGRDFLSNPFELGCFASFIR